MKGLEWVMLSGNLPPPMSRFVQYENWICSCPRIKFTSWNENIGGRNALDLLYLKTILWSSHLWGAIPKQPAITRQTLKDVSNKYESVFLFIPWPPVNFHLNRGDFLLKIRGGPWGGPWTGSTGWSMDQIHGVVHGPRSMFCIRPSYLPHFCL